MAVDRIPSNLIILFAITFFVIGAAIVGAFLVGDQNEHKTDCRGRGGVPVQGVNGAGAVVCLDPSVLR